MPASRLNGRGGAAPRRRSGSSRRRGWARRQQRQAQRAYDSYRQHPPDLEAQLRAALRSVIRSTTETASEARPVVFTARLIWSRGRSPVVVSSENGVAVVMLLMKVWPVPVHDV